MAEGRGKGEEKWGEFAFAVQRLTDCKAFFSSLPSLQPFPFTVADLLPAAGGRAPPLSSLFKVFPREPGMKFTEGVLNVWELLLCYL